MGISISFISLKTTFFKMKRNPCLAVCKNKYTLSIHRLNTQIGQHVEKFRLFFHRSRDHGRGIMTSYLGSLVYKSLKLTKIMPNSLKLLDHYILSNAPQKIRQQALKEARKGFQVHARAQSAHAITKMHASAESVLKSVHRKLMLREIAQTGNKICGKHLYLARRFVR